MSITEFDPITAPGGYVKMVYAYPPVARRNISPTTTGAAIATHLGYIQKKTLLILWHPLELNLELHIVAEEVDPDGKGAFNRDGEPSTSPIIDESVNLWSTEVNFVRYMTSGPSSTSATYTPNAHERNYQY